MRTGASARRPDGVAGGELPKGKKPQPRDTTDTSERMRPFRTIAFNPPATTWWLLVGKNVRRLLFLYLNLRGVAVGKIPYRAVGISLTYLSHIKPRIEGKLLNPVCGS